MQARNDARGGKSYNLSSCLWDKTKQTVTELNKQTEK